MQYNINSSNVDLNIRGKHSPLDYSVYLYTATKYCPQTIYRALDKREYLVIIRDIFC